MSKAVGRSRPSFTFIFLATITLVIVSVVVVYRFKVAASNARPIVAASHQTSLREELSAAGLVTYRHVATLAPPSGAGRLLDLKVAVGQSVLSADPVMEFESLRPATEIMRRDLAVRRARAALRRLEDDRSSTLDDLEVAQAEMRAAEAEWDDFQKAANRLIVRSPFAGIVVQAPDSWGVGSSQPVVSIAPLDGRIVDVELSERELRQLTAGAKVNVTFSDGSLVSAVFDGSYVLRRMRPMGGVFAVALKLPDRTTGPFGVSVVVRFLVREIPDALVVPRSAVKWSGDRAFVTTLRDGWQETKEVKTGIVTDDLVQITAGLGVGVRVVLEPLGTGREGSR